MTTLHLISIGGRQPRWVIDATTEYQKRLPKPWIWRNVELALPQRRKNSVVDQLRKAEAEQLRNAVPDGALVIALDERGQAWRTRDLAAQMQRWQLDFSDVALLIGGPDGLDRDYRQTIATHWSLSPLTLPHGLVRIVVAEQIYRGHSLLTNHPYHRA